MASEKIAYSIVELIDAVSISRTKIYEEIKSGRLRPTKIGSRTIFTSKEIERWLSDSAIKRKGENE